MEAESVPHKKWNQVLLSGLGCLFGTMVMHLVNQNPISEIYLLYIYYQKLANKNLKCQLTLKLTALFCRGNFKLKWCYF
jgi:hypothetical protein